MNALNRFVIFVLMNTLRYILMPSLVFILYATLVTFLSGIIAQYLFEVNVDHIFSIGIWGGIFVVIGYFYLVFKHNLFKHLYKGVL